MWVYIMARTFRLGKGTSVNENIITFNFANWITVVLMVAVGFAILGFAQKLYTQQSQAA
jgi:hypothetical protein